MSDASKTRGSRLINAARQLVVLLIVGGAVAVAYVSVMGWLYVALGPVGAGFR